MRSHLESSNPHLLEAQAAMRARHQPHTHEGVEVCAEPATKPTNENLTIRDIASRLNCSHDNALRLFRDHPETFSINPDAKCQRPNLRVPAWVVDEFIACRKRKPPTSVPSAEEETGVS